MWVYDDPEGRSQSPVRASRVRAGCWSLLTRLHAPRDPSVGFRRNQHPAGRGARSGSNRLTRTKLRQRSGEGGYRPNGELRATFGGVYDPHALGSRGFAEAPTPLAHSLGAAH